MTVSSDTNAKVASVVSSKVLNTKHHSKSLQRIHQKNTTIIERDDVLQSSNTRRRFKRRGSRAPSMMFSLQDLLTVDEVRTEEDSTTTTSIATRIIGEINESFSSMNTVAASQSSIAEEASTTSSCLDESCNSWH